MRQFDAAWLEIAAQGPDGYEEAMAAAMQWRQARRYWTADPPSVGAAGFQGNDTGNDQRYATDLGRCQGFSE